MKKTIYILFTTLIAAFSFISCSEWLDEVHKTDVPATQLFETENGFMSSLAGLYITMTNEDTYGKNMSFGLVEQLAQMYDKLPDQVSNPNNIYIYDSDGTGFNTKGSLASIWLGQYHIIANANNLLRWLDLNGASVIKNDDTRNMLRGEALAIRAYLHFDLLRGWGPMNYSGNPDAKSMKCIPYRTVADKSKQPLLKAEDVVKYIIKDLEDAKTLLSYEKEISLGDKLYRDRRFRFNYHAINAVLARVYNYAGETKKARDCAVDVIDNCGLSLMSGNDGDPILFDEVLCGLSMHELKENLSEYFSEGDKIEIKNYVTLTTASKLFETAGAESEDMRAKSTAFIKDNERWLSKKYIDNDNQVIPLIRLPEMYYIVCETSEGDEAAEYVNTVRNKRGISISKNVTCNTKEEIIDALNKEYRKEFYAEGQYFWFLKSHGLTGPLVHNSGVTLVEESFIFPLPDNEKEYGWTEVNDENENNTEENTPNV